MFLTSKRRVIIFHNYLILYINPIDIIDAFLFELQNSINPEFKNIFAYNDQNADDYADALEFAEDKSLTYYNNLISKLLKDNNRKELEKLFDEFHYPLILSGNNL